MQNSTENKDCKKSKNAKCVRNAKNATIPIMQRKQKFKN